MAIFIVDQFSLNTDLPLDIRYVPDGGSYNDVSAYWYPGMQVYQTSDQAIWFADNSLNWHPISEGIDASLSELYQTVIDLSTYVTNIVNIHDASIGDLYNITNQLDASIERIDVSLNDYGQLLAIHDASIGDLYSTISVIDASIGDIYDYQAIQDGSITANTSDILQIESSIGDINSYQTIQDASIKANEDDINQLDASIIRIDGSLNDIYSYQAIQDASIITLDSSVTYLFGQLGSDDASLNELYQYNTIQDGSISTNTDNITIIDGSITSLTTIVNIHDASIGQLETDVNNLESSLGLFVAKAGDTMTGPLVISAGGLSVANDISIGGGASIIGDLQVGGDLTVDGSTTIVNSTVVDISTNFIYLNTGLTGIPPAWLQSGLVVERGDASAYAVIFDETDKTFRVGIVWNQDASGVYQDSMTKPVAAREDNAINTGVPYWLETAPNNGLFDTDITFTYTVLDGLKLDTSLNLSGLAGASNLMLVVNPDGYVEAQVIPNVDASLNELYGDVANLETSVGSLDGLIQTNITDITNLETSVGALDGLIQTNITDIGNLESSVGALDLLTQIHDSSIGTLDSSVTELYSLVGDTSVKGAINIGDGSAGVYAGLTADGSLQFREFVGVGAATITQNGSLIEVGIDASFGGEVNTASNIGTGEGLSATKQGEDLPFKSISTLDPSTVIITSDNSTLYIDVSIDSISDASLSGLTDTSINDANLVDHTNMEYDSVAEKWVETQNGWWDTSLGTTTGDLGGIPAGTDLEGQTLKDILFKILYQYQPPTLSTSTSPTSGIFEKGLASTQFSSIDVNWNATNTNYPIALLNNVHVSKTGSGSIFDASLGLVASDVSMYTDATGITNWGGTNRTISYNVTIDDDQADQSQPAVGSSKSFTFYYRQYWGIVDGDVSAGAVDSAMIKGLVDSRLAGETNLTATFDNSTGGFVKYLFAYPDTVAAPDNFGVLSQILDQNSFDITGSWDTDYEDVSVGANNVRYRFYLAKNKVDTTDFDITFKF